MSWHCNTRPVSLRKQTSNHIRPKPFFYAGSLTNAQCLGISPAGSSQPVLGDTFLRSAYVVYDLGNNEISLAATNFNATSSSVREIGTGDNAVPDATVIQNAVTTAAVSTGGARNGGLPSGVTGTSSAEKTFSMEGGLRLWGCTAVALVGVAVGAGLVTL